MTIGLLITTYNRSSLLEVSLNRIAQLTLPDEILVVDDGGDNPQDDCEGTCRRVVIDCPVRYLRTNNPGQQMCSHARNVGIKTLTTDLVLTCEPEMYFRSDIVAQFLAKHEERPDDCLNAGTIIHKHNDGPDTTTVNWHATWVSMYGRQWLLDIGGWDEQFPDPWGWEDTDLVTRLVASGHGTTIMTECEAVHQWHPEQHHRQDRNEAHFKAKMDEARCMQVIANVGNDWGVVKV